MADTGTSIENTGGVPEIDLDLEVSSSPEVSFSLEVAGMTQTPVDATLSIEDMAADAKATGDAIRALEDEVGDIEADISGIVGTVYPVGSIYMTTANLLPAALSAVGTWNEIKVPVTWGDMKNGTRSYQSTGTGFTAGSIHFWLRTS